MPARVKRVATSLIRECLPIQIKSKKNFASGLLFAGIGWRSPWGPPATTGRSESSRTSNPRAAHAPSAWRALAYCSI